MSALGDDTRGRPRRLRTEIFAFLFLTAVVMPALAVATVGSYGLVVWVYQIGRRAAGTAPAALIPHIRTDCLDQD
jgi:periplasmic nitrate reductase NapE